LTAAGKADDQAQVVELTGLLRHFVGPDGGVCDQLAGWPPGWTRAEDLTNDWPRIHAPHPA
jgi:hypothetical protein